MIILFIHGVSRSNDTIQVVFPGRASGNQGQAIQSNFFGSRQTIQFRQTALSAPYYVHTWYHPLGVASCLYQHRRFRVRWIRFWHV